MELLTESSSRFRANKHGSVCKFFRSYLRKANLVKCDMGSLHFAGRHWAVQSRGIPALLPQYVKLHISFKKKINVIHSYIELFHGLSQKRA